MLFRPAAKGGGAAGGIDQGHNGAQDHQEQEDARIVGDGGDKAVVDNGVHSLDKGKAAVEQGSHQNADEQGGVGLLGDEGQADGDDGRQEGPKGVVELADRFHNVFSPFFPA